MHRGRQESQDHGDREAPCAGIRRQADQHFPKPTEEKHHDGQNGSELDHHVEHLAEVVLKAEQLAGKDQMAGRGDRQKFGETLDGAEDQGGQNMS